MIDGTWAALGRWLCMVTAAMVLLMAVPTVAQGDGGATTQSPAATDTAAGNPASNEGSSIAKTGELPTVFDLFMTSKVINGILLGLSAVALLLFIFFLLTIHGHAMAPRSFVDDVTRLVIDGEYKQAADYCRSNRNIFAASIVQRCVENADKDQAVIMSMLEGEGRRRADILWNRISYLSDVANVAPMLGLLGTVLGMIKAFYGLQFEAAAASSKTLSGSIGEAMATTLFGLGVAIIAIVFHSFIKGRTTKTLAEVEAVVNSIADHLKRRPRSDAAREETVRRVARPGARPSSGGGSSRDSGD